MSDRVALARAFAVAAHGDQRYGDRPYEAHLAEVAALAAPYGEEAQVAAWLHDALEDTAATEAELAALFGAELAAVVALLTDPEGPTRAARKALLHARLAALDARGPEALALVVKAADRLANVLACRADGKHGKLAVYAREHAAFRAAVWRAGLAEALWARLDAETPGAGRTDDGAGG